MSPRQLIEKLESLGIIDPKILEKIRKEVDNPEKTVKPKAVLSYLVKKKQITEQQAKMILKTPPKEDELEVVQPAEKDYDTGDLTGIAKEAEPEVVPEVAISSVPDAHAATMIDDGAIAREVNPELVVSTVFDGQPVVEEIQEADPIAYGGLGDDGFDNGDYASGGYPTQGGSGPQQVLPSFKGKRDKKDQWATKWLYIGFGILGSLLIGVAILWIVNMGQSAEDMMAAAMDSFNKQSYADATKKFEEFLDRFPDHEDSPTARAKRVHSIIRGTYGLKNWSEVIQQSEVLLPDLEEPGEKLSDLREDLSVMLPRALAEISNKAVKTNELSVMEVELTKIEGYLETVSNPVYIPMSMRKAPSVNDNYLRIDNNKRTIEGQIDKEKRYNADLVAIRDLRESKKTDEAFAIYQKLVRNYGDLGSRDELRELMLSISDTERQLVLPGEFSAAPTATEPETIIQSTVVLATKSGEPVNGLEEEIVCFLADGAVYGVDAGVGTIVWRRFVGFETSSQPIDINEGSLLISNQRDHQLITVDKRTGKLQWRTEVNEPFLQPVGGEQVVVFTTESGKVVELNSMTGQVVKSAQLPQPANVSPMVAARDPYVYQVGSYQNLYVLSSLDYSCSEVHYLGHYEGSISIPPQAWTGYILIAVNGGNSCELQVLKPESKGLGLKRVQTMSIDGTVSTPLQRFGRWMLVTSDTGEMKILELYPSDEKNPVQVLTQDVFDAKGRRAYMKSDGSNLWVAGRGIMRYKIQRNLGEFGREILLNPNDTFISPVQKLDDYLLHVRKRNNSGMISVSLVDAMKLTPVWRTDIGGELAGPPLSFDDKVVVVSNQGDMFSIDGATEAKGYSDTPTRANEVLEDLVFSETIQLNKDTFAVIGPEDHKDLLLAQGTTGKSKMLALSPPADKPACRPIAIGMNLIIPTVSGEVTCVNPVNGRMTGTPFQPPIEPSAEKPKWFEPALISPTTFAIASGATDDGAKSMLYLLDGKNPRVVEKMDQLELESSIKSRLVSDGSNVFGVVEGDAGDKLALFTTAKPLAIGAQAELGAAIVDGPWLTKAGILVLLDNDKLYCFGTDLSGKWSVDMPNEKLACNPEVVGTQLMVCFQNGKVNLLDPATGKLGTEFNVGQPINHTPLRAGEKMYFGGLDGTVHVINLNKLSQ